MAPLRTDELEHVLRENATGWPELRGGALFITGGTGFFGKWLLESLLCADAAYGLSAKAYVLTRNPAPFVLGYPHLANDPRVELVQGDLNVWSAPTLRCTHFIHAATSVREQEDGPDLSSLAESILFGAERAIRMASEMGAKKFLLCSSGSVYGEQALAEGPTAEDASLTSGFHSVATASGFGKRRAEEGCRALAEAHRIELKIARGFTFAGPHLPLEGRFAFGNFIHDGLAGRPIEVKGTGKVYRSYLYSADLCAWLWKILFNGKAGETYNVGSEQAISIAELAQKVSRFLGLPVTCRRESDLNGSPSFYVPQTGKARALGLRESFPLETAIERTVSWNRLSKRVVS